ncbi:LacI family DNA-binding transcriptional regulator [Bifidobacterium bombi]|uniref:Transcriptional regulator, LacI family n=1 Tax=Bifidobacterium bombi DSM 19703 TaxID=1341695 RepID=A0A080N4L9_9BIFI|nr:LacI family DNA-binding transcriptional regulator [Bifidobacterium bombi]KFF31515.1 transcriptional regulator, LacI family [Bifidobacterium bombi DSM 19703]
MTTIKEVAKRAGASVTAVSLSLNHREAGHVKPEIARKIRRTAQEMGYKPSPLASSLRTSRTRTIGFVSEEIATTPYAGEIVLGAQDAASELGYMMLLVNTDGKANEDEEIAALRRYGVDGYMYAKMYNRVTVRPSCLDGVPTVIVNASDVTGATPSIAPDEVAIGSDATNRLIEAGCKRIAYVGCSENLRAESLREQGYEKALKGAGMSFDPRLRIAVGNNGPALEAVAHLFRSAHPDGFFCFNDARTWYVYACAARLDLRIGEDVSVVGVDNHRVVAQTLAPKLTTMALPHYEMGYWGTRRLVHEIEGRDLSVPSSLGMQDQWRASIPPLDGPNERLIHCRLIERESVREG